MSFTVHGTKGPTGGATDGMYFENQARSRYFHEGGEPPGRWHGLGAKALGLVGTIHVDPFRNLLAGLKPDGSGPLVQVQKTSKADRRSRASALELTASADKTFSAMWAVSDEHVRQIMSDCFDKAAVETLSTLERMLPLARRGKGGQQHEVAKLIFAMYDHCTSRAEKPEPQYHRHILVINACQRGDSTWSCVDSRLLARWVRTSGPMFRVALAQKLRERLGCDLYRPRLATGKLATTWSIRGVPMKLCDYWSTRSAEIRNLLAGPNGKFLSTIRGLSSAHAREQANLQTRGRKQLTPPRKELFETWRQTAVELGINLEDVAKLVKPYRQETVETAYAKGLSHALRELTEQHAHFSARELIQKVCEALQTTAIGLERLLAWVERDLAQHKDIVRLKPLCNEDRFTTGEMWRLEEKLLAAADRLKKTTGPVVESSTITDVIRARKTISADQSKAVRELLENSSRFKILTGVAGAGKTFVLDTIRSGYVRAGYNVIGAALAGVAAEELQKSAKIPARTVASLLYHADQSNPAQLRDRVIHDAKQLVRAALGKPTARYEGIKIDSKTVIVLDEIGMLDTRSLYRLVRIAERQGATIVLVGDHKQLPPIEAGGPLGYLLKKHGHAFLAENRRQRDAADRKAVADLRNGRVEQSLESYAARGRLTVAKDRAAAVERLVKTWAAEGGKKKPQQHVIFTETRAEADVINRLCQRERLKALRINPLARVRVNGQSLHIGDRVIFRQKMSQYGIQNGYLGKVVRINPTVGSMGTITIKLDNPIPTVSRFAKKIDMLTIPVRELRDDRISLAYASTTHSSQGRTVENSYLLMGSRLTSREITYVQATRARHKTHMFTDELHAGKQLKDLARSLKSKPKDLAHDIGLTSTQDRTLRLQIERDRT